MPQPTNTNGVEEPEITPHQYARLSGMARDYLHYSIGAAAVELEYLRKDADQGISDHSYLPQFDFGPELNVQERLKVPKEAATLISWVQEEDNIDTINAIMAPMFRPTATRNKMKLELPLLRTDHETDCREFARRNDFEIKLQDIRLPFEVVNEENCEGLTWPARYWNLGSDYMEDIKKERLQAKRDTLAYLNDALKCEWTAEDTKNLWEGQKTYKRRKALEPVTPPLSPLLVPAQPFEPSSSDEAFNVPLLSDPDSPTKQELERIEKKLFKQDIPSPIRKYRASKNPEHSSSDTYVGDEEIRLGQVYSPLAFLDADVPPSVKTERVRPEDFKVEGPLTPEMPIPGLPKLVRFSEVIEEFVPPASRNSTPKFDEDAFFQEAFRAAAQEANQKLEQEKLIAADTVSRVDEPLMDFTKPEPPWKQFEQCRDPSSLVSLRISHIRDVISHCSILPEWRGPKHKLRWLPFPKSLAEDALEDKYPVQDDAQLSIFLGETEEVINSSSLTWKPPGLRILNDNDDDDDGGDEIEFAIFQEGHSQDISVLAKKRKLEMEEAANIRQGTSTPRGLAHTDNKVMPAVSAKPKAYDFMTAEQKMQLDISHEEKSGLLGGPFVVMNSLDNYLETRGAKKAKLSDTSYFVSKDPQAKPAKEHQTTKLPTPQQAFIELPIRNSPLAKAEPLPAPFTQASSDKISVITSSTLFKHKTLIKYLESNMPSIQFIERDWKAHNTTIWIPGSITRSPVDSPLADEADMIISPSTGIVITTLQKIKQKLLPGQKGKPAIRDRVEKVSFRYEKLLIFVTEGRSDESTNGLDESDCIAFSDFVGFTMGLDTSITVQFVGGGEQTLSQWLTSTIMQHGKDQKSDLLDEETHWELFLRLAGLNAFAAQAIIQELKAPEGVDPNDPTKAGHFGLTAFVEMGKPGRVARFSHLCGRRVLERVSMLDRIWE